MRLGEETAKKKEEDRRKERSADTHTQQAIESIDRGCVVCKQRGVFESITHAPAAPPR